MLYDIMIPLSSAFRRGWARSWGWVWRRDAQMAQPDGKGMGRHYLGTWSGYSWLVDHSFDNPLSDYHPSGIYISPTWGFHQDHPINCHMIGLRWATQVARYCRLPRHGQGLGGRIRSISFVYCFKTIFCIFWVCFVYIRRDTLTILFSRIGRSCRWMRWMTWRFRLPFFDPKRL